ncbi:MAG: hypothetical protein ABFD50_16100 [Smithella sp.]
MRERVIAERVIVGMNNIASDILALAKDLLGMDFPDQNSLDKYLKKHPDANRSNHKVVEQYSQYEDAERPLGIIRRHGAKQ